MFAFLRRPKLVTDEVEPSQPSTHMLSFDPSGVVRAITFHLLDEGKARAVSHESSAAAVEKLNHRMGDVTISADRWVMMTNPQRLQWLLDRSHVVVREEWPGTAELFVRR